MAKASMGKGNKTQLTKNFKAEEFDCKCDNDECMYTIFDTEHIDKLQRLRDLIKRPIRITSAFRCVKHNKEVGGTIESRHLFGDATDIQIIGKLPDSVYKLILEVGFDGFGKYDTFTHLDSRGFKVSWDFRSKLDDDKNKDNEEKK